MTVLISMVTLFLLECRDKEYVYISESENIDFKTDDKIIDYISLMGNNMCPSTVAVEEKKSQISYQIFTTFLKAIKLNYDFCYTQQTITWIHFLTPWEKWRRLF